MFVKSIENKSDSFYIGYGKRICDFIISSILLLVLSPIFIVIALLVKTDSKGPVIYSQLRVGRNWKVFTLYKFRTMKNDSQSNGLRITVLNDSRITPIGRILRKYKLDEMPQLFNIFKGDMSVVGPRPESKKYVELYKEDYSEILQIQPGLTDYALIEFRNEEEILAGYEDAEQAYINLILPEKISLYKKYINEMSFVTDVKIVLKTFLRVIRN